MIARGLEIQKMASKDYDVYELYCVYIKAFDPLVEIIYKKKRHSTSLSI
jgi:hypothetical protein